MVDAEGIPISGQDIFAAQEEEEEEKLRREAEEKEKKKRYESPYKELYKDEKG